MLAEAEGNAVAPPTALSTAQAAACRRFFAANYGSSLARSGDIW
jgi:hypothetical protein